MDQSIGIQAPFTSYTEDLEESNHCSTPFFPSNNNFTVGFFYAPEDSNYNKDFQIIPKGTFQRLHSYGGESCFPSIKISQSVLSTKSCQKKSSLKSNNQKPKKRSITTVKRRPNKNRKIDNHLQTSACCNCSIQ